MITSIIILSIIGILLSIYLFYVEQKLKQDKSHKSICDINEKISCSAVAKSNYANILGISNTIIGLGFYIIVLILAIFNKANIIFPIAIISAIATAYLIYAMFKLKKICIVCLAANMVNFIILIFSYLSLN